MTDVTPPSRSILRRIHQPGPSRRRPYLLRLLGLALVIAVLGYTATAITLEWWSKDGIARPLYVLHDSIWLRLRGTLWTAYYPYSLLWAVPVLIILAILLVEWHTPCGIARWHRRSIVVVAQVLGRFWALAFLMGSRRTEEGARWLRPKEWQSARAEQDTTQKSGYAIRVLSEARLAAWIEAIGTEPTERKALRRLVSLDRHILQLSPSDPRVALRAVETVLLASKAAGAEPLAKDLEARLNALVEAAPETIGADARALLRVLDAEDRMKTKALAELRQIASAAKDQSASPVVLACLLLRAATGDDNASTFRSFFDSWTLLRARPSFLQLPVARAESMVESVLWVARAESRILAQTKPGMLERLLPGVDHAEALGELYLDGGQS